MLHEQIQTALIEDESVPWMPFTPHAPRVMVKVFKVDSIRGDMVLLMRAPVGAGLPRHQHSSTAIVYTIAGRWKYLEHDWIAGPGSLVYPTAASSHIRQVVGAEDALTLNLFSGDLAFLGPAGQVLAIENWRSMLQRYLDHCHRASIAPRDITAFR